VIEHNDRNLGEPQLPRRQQAAVTRNDAGLRVDQFVSTNMGLLNPNSAILAAIGAICASECVRGLRANGTSLGQPQIEMLHHRCRVILVSV
jgi:hypothetical protein